MMAGRKNAGAISVDASPKLDDLLMLSEAGHELKLSPGHIYNMGVRRELDMVRVERLKKWMVTKASVEKYKKANASGA